ncbi:rcc01693 family protein [Pseudoroseicyclus sp. H15]
MSRIDWPGLMRLGLRGLRLKPAEFWALTPAELLVMLGQDGAGAMGRARLGELAARFPDRGAGEEGGGGRCPPPAAPPGYLQKSEGEEGAGPRVAGDVADDG